MSAEIKTARRCPRELDQEYFIPVVRHGATKYEAGDPTLKLEVADLALTGMEVQASVTAAYVLRVLLPVKLPSVEAIEQPELLAKEDG